MIGHHPHFEGEPDKTLRRTADRGTSIGAVFNSVMTPVRPQHGKANGRLVTKKGQGGERGTCLVGGESADTNQIARSFKVTPFGKWFQKYKQGQSTYHSLSCVRL